MMTRQAIIAELKQLGVDVPDESNTPTTQPSGGQMSRQAILAELKQLGVEVPSEPHPAWSGPPGATVTGERASLPAKIKRTAGQAARYGMEGIADLLGIVADPLAATANMGLTALRPDAQRFKTLRGTVTGALDRAGLPAAESDNEKLIAEGVRGGVGALTGVGIASQIGKRVVAPMAVKAAKFFSDAPKIQAVGGAAAGMAGENIRQGGGNGVEQFLGSMLAGMSPAAAVGALQAIKYAVAGNSWKTAGRERQAVEQLKQLVPPGKEGDLIQILDRAIEQGGVLPGSKPTTAQAIGRSSPDDLARDAFTMERVAAGPEVMAREAERNSVRTSALDDLAPGGDPNALSASVRERIERLAAKAAEIQSRRTEQARQGMAQAGRPIEAAQAGDAIRAVDDAGFGAASGRTSAAYQDPELQAMLAQLPRAEIDAIMAKYYGAAPELADSKLRQIAASTRRLSEPDPSPLAIEPRVPFRDIQNLRGDASELANTAARGGANKTASAARAMRQAFDDISPEAGATPEQSALYGRARAARVDQAERFETGPTKAMRQMGSDNNPKLQGAEIPKKFFHTGDTAREDAAQYIRAYGDNPEAMQTASRYIVQQLRDQATDANGAIDAAKLDRWVTAYRPAIDAIDPTITPRMRDVQRAQQLADSQGERIVRDQRDVDRSALGLILKADTPEHAIAQAMNSKNANHELTRVMHLVRGDPDAVNGLRRAMIEFVQTKADKFMAKTPGQTGETLGQAGFTKALKTYDSKLKQVFSADDLAVMRRVSEDLEQGAWSSNTGRGAGSDTQPKESMASTLGGLMVPGAGGVVTGFTAMRNFLLSKPRADVKRIFKEALLDPAFARDLARRASESQAKLILPKLQAIANGFAKGAAVTSTARGSGAYWDESEQNVEE